MLFQFRIWIFLAQLDCISRNLCRSFWWRRGRHLHNVMALNRQQSEVLQFATSGHNLLLTGQAGSGKSGVVGSILQECNSKNLRVAVLCSSGIACKVYPSAIASTVHSYYGLGTADLPSRKLLERAKANSVVHHNIENADVVIWDEASMSSARMVEIVNCAPRNVH